MRRLLTLVLAAVAAAFFLLAVATSIPFLAFLALVYALVAWSAWRTGANARLRALRQIGSGLAAAVGAILVAAISLVWLNAQPPVPDAFYEASGVIPSEPGALLRAEPFTRALPAGTRAWRILYTTTRDEGKPGVASALVLAPAETMTDARPVIAWTHGTTGVMSGCAPSVLPAPFPFDATVPALAQLIAEKWVLVGPDYVGLGTAGGHPYLIGEGEGRSALDALRAVRRLPDVKLDARNVVWGHSQGGHAALWTGILAPRYAPDVDVSGVAALAPATDIGPLLDAAQHTVVGKIMSSYVATAYSATYPDVRLDEYVRTPARARAMASRCLSGPGALLSVLTSVTMEMGLFAKPPNEGPLGERLKENVPTGPIAAPLLIAQGLTDDLVLPAVQERYVRARCDAGQRLEYRTYTGRDHVGLVRSDSPLTNDLVQWTRDRLAGVPIDSGCRTVER